MRPVGSIAVGYRFKNRFEAAAIHEWPRRAPLLGSWLRQGRPAVMHIHWIQEFLGGSKGTPTARNVRWFDWQLRVLKSRGVRIVWTVHNLKAHGSKGSDPRDAQAHRAVQGDISGVTASLGTAFNSTFNCNSIRKSS